MEGGETAVFLSRTHEELPEEIKQKLSGANLFFTPEYEKYAHLAGFSLLYAYDASFAAVMDIYPAYSIRFAVFPSEIFSFEAQEDPEKKQKFLDEVIAVLKEKTDLAWVSNGTASLFDLFPADSVRIPFGSFISDLTLPEKELWHRVHSSHKNCINSARRNGIVLKMGEKKCREDYLLLDRDTWRRSGLQGYDPEFLRIFDEGLGDHSLICTAYLNEVPQAGACYYFNQQMVYNIYSASSDRIAKGAMKYLHWEMMMYFKRMGVKKFNFVGYRFRVDEDSKHRGIQEFKRLFGTDLFRGYLFRCILKPARRILFQQLFRAENGCVFADTIDRELNKWPEMNEGKGLDK